MNGVTQGYEPVQCTGEDLHSNKRVYHPQPETSRGGSANGTNELQTHALDACGSSCLKPDDAPQKPTG